MMIGFVNSQILQLKQEGFQAFYRKTRMVMRVLPLVVFYYFPLLLLSAPALLGVRIIRRRLLVRWLVMNSMRLGHYAANVELYLCEKEAGINTPKQRYVDFLCAKNPRVCNNYLGIIWGRTVKHVLPAGSLRPISALNAFFPGGEVHEIGHNTQHDRDVHGLYRRFTPFIKLNGKEEERGSMELRKMGIPGNAKIVLIHSRCPAYLKKLYHDREDVENHYRNSDIGNFLKAADFLAEKGFFVLRMGAEYVNVLDVDNPLIIDYAAKHRSEFMDIYLGAKCHFYLGDSCGINAVPMIFRRPVVTTNFVPLEYANTWWPNLLTIPKKHWLEKENRVMTFREIFESGAGKFLTGSEFEEAGIRLIENTPEEIADAATEAVERLEGAWEGEPGDEELQKRFWEIFPVNGTDARGIPLHGGISARIGAKFLRENREMLD